MRFFHLSDLHIGLKLMNHDLKEDQEYVLKQIIEYAVVKKPDAVVIAGDIYDKAVPSAEAVAVFDHFVASLADCLPETVIMMISGNHDSGQRLNCFRSILLRQNVFMVGLPPEGPDETIEKVTLTDACGPVHFYLLPFVKPSMIKGITGVQENGNNYSYNDALGLLLDREEIDTTQRNVLVSHQFYIPAGQSAEEVERMDSEIPIVGNVDAVSSKILQPFDYAALGHIHKPMHVGKGPYYYCGTPLACSVSEAGQKKGIIMVDLGEKDPSIKEGVKLTTEVLPLAPLHQIRVIEGPFEEVVRQGSDDYVRVVLTDKEDLPVFDMHDRLVTAFPRLLEIQRKGTIRADYSVKAGEGLIRDPFRMCCEFMPDMDEEQKALILDVIRTLSEGGEEARQ